MTAVDAASAGPTTAAPVGRVDAGAHESDHAARPVRPAAGAAGRTRPSTVAGTTHDEPRPSTPRTQRRRPGPARVVERPAIRSVLSRSAAAGARPAGSRPGSASPGSAPDRQAPAAARPPPPRGRGRSARSSGCRPRRPAGTAGRRRRPGGRGGTRSPRRGRWPPHSGSGRRAGGRARRPGAPPGRPRWARPRATVTRFDFGAQARCTTAWARLSWASGSPTNSTARAAASATTRASGSASPDVLAGQDDQPAGDEPGVLARLEHPGQPVEAGVGIRAPDRLDEGADLVVVVVLAVVLQPGVAGPLHVVEGHRPRARRRARATSSVVSTARASPSARPTRAATASGLGRRRPRRPAPGPPPRPARRRRGARGATGSTATAAGR